MQSIENQYLSHVSTSILFDWQKGLIQKDKNREAFTIPNVVIDQNAIVVILDLSGYTKATLLLMEQAEEKHINSLDSFNASQYVGKLVKFCLDPLLQLVNAYGGDMLNYGGDALFCIWRESDENYSSRVTKALQCCIEAAKWVRQHPLLDFESRTIPLAVHAVMHACHVELLHLGDPFLNHLECIANGEGYFNACNLLSIAKQDEIVLTKSTLDLIDISSFNNISIQKHTNDYIVLLVDVKSLSNVVPQDAEPLRQRLISLLTPYQIQMISKLYVDPAILHRPLGAAEIRQASIAFIRLQYLGSNAAFLWSVNELLTSTLQICQPSSDSSPLGILRQISQDDKGLSLMILFGLPPATSENPCVTAACVCLKLLNTINLLRNPFQAWFGISTGRVFSGCISNQSGKRLEHAVLGQAVNLAARFMTVAEEGTILCDKPTHDMLLKATTLVSLEALPNPLKIKGYQDTVPAWKVLESQLETGISKLSLQSSKNFTTTVDFHDPKDDLVWKNYIWERKETQSVLKRNLFTIEGPSGSGKSFTASRISRFCFNNGYVVWNVPTFEIEKSTAFSCVKHLMTLINRLFTKNEKCKEILETAEENYPEQQGFDLICTALNVPTKHQVVIRDLQKFVLTNLTATSVQGSSVATTNSGFSRTSPDDILLSATESVTTILNAIADVIELLIVFDDCQWLDRYSWAILSAIHVQCPKLLTLCISRPPKEYSDPKLQNLYVILTQSPTTYHIAVGAISMERTKTVVQSKFPQLPFAQAEELTRRLVEMSSGNAFALDVLLRHIEHNMNNNQISDSVLAVLPKDAKAVFVSQLDNLDPTFQSIVRTAALIGQVFKMTDLLALCDMPQISLLEMHSKIMDWDKFGFMEPLEDNKWRFKHYLISFQISSLMTGDERNRRWRKIAEYFESMLRQPQRHLNKPELLPLLSGLYHRLEENDDAYRIDCKLVSLYHRQRMGFECRKLLLTLVQDKKRFQALESKVRDKINLIGVSVSFVLLDIEMAHLFFRPFVKAYGNLELKNCLLMNVFQFFGAVNKLEAHYQVIRKTGQWPKIEDKRTNVEKKRYDTFIRVLTGGPEVPHDLGLTLQLHTAKVVSEMELLLLNDSFEQRTENLVMTMSTFFAFDKYESAVHLRDYLGIATLDPQKPFMKMIQKFEKMSLSELEKVPYGLFSVTHFVGPYYYCFEVNHYIGYQVALILWNIAYRHRNMRLQEAAMYTFPDIASKQFEGRLSNDDPIILHCRSFRMTFEQQPAFSPDISSACSVLGCALLHVAEVYHALMKPEQYENELKNVAMTLSDVNFAEEFVRKRAPLLNCNQTELLLQLVTSPWLMFFDCVRGDYANAVDHLERSCSSLGRLQGEFKLIFSGASCDSFVQFYLTLAFRSYASESMNDIISDSLYQRAHKILWAFVSKCHSMYRKTQSRWRCINMLEGGCFMMQAIKETMKIRSSSDCAAVIPVAQKALEYAKRVHSLKGQLSFHELSMYMKAGVVPRQVLQKNSFELTEERKTQCKEHLRNILELFSKTTALWSPARIKRIAKVHEVSI